MRILKKPDKINVNKNTGKVEPYRTFYLTDDEIARIKDLPKDNAGNIKSNKLSEELLKDILDVRGMGSLLYPEREIDDWTGYVRVLDSGMIWLL